MAPSFADTCFSLASAAREVSERSLSDKGLLDLLGGLSNDTGTRQAGQLHEAPQKMTDDGELSCKARDLFAGREAGLAIATGMGRRTLVHHRNIWVRLVDQKLDFAGEESRTTALEINNMLQSNPNVVSAMVCPLVVPVSITGLCPFRHKLPR